MGGRVQPALVVVGGIGLLIVGGLWFRDGSRRADHGTSGPGSALEDRPGLTPDHADLLARQEERLAAIEARLSAIEDSLARLSASPRTPVPTAIAPPPPAVAEAPSAPPDALAGRGESRVEELQRIALDEARSLHDRIEALGELWRIDLARGTNSARTPRIVDALLARLELEPNAELRRLLCFHVLGAVEPGQETPLLRTLEADLDAAVRAQAADTLQDLVADPRVRAALERSAAGDPVEEVRATAAEMLRRWRERPR